MDRKSYDNRITGKAKMHRTGAIRQKLRDRAGFSLAETLLAVLILLLVSVIVATGMPAVTNAYNKVILGANAKTMLSTAVTALHDELGTAWQIKNSADNKSLTYFSASTGAKTMISLKSGIVWIDEYISLSEDLIHDIDEATMQTNHQKKGYALVTSSSSGMYVTYGDDGGKWIYYDEDTGIVTIKGLKVCKESDDTPLAQYVGENGQDKDFTIRVISKDAVETGT